MNIFDLLTMFGGLAFFLYGMNCMEGGLSKLSGGRLEHLLEKFTSGKLRAVALGAVVTALIQSSSATTVMTVGLVNSGLLQLKQAVGIIMGANIGTTVTSWILSLSGIDSGNFFVKMLKPTAFSPVLAVLGISFLMFSKKERRHNLGTIFIGFALLMFGMDTMSKAVAPLSDVPEFTRILTMFSNPVLGLLAGAFLTAVIQSSSASVGILQTLCSTGAVTVGSAVPIIMGQNIGTCVTALLSGIGATKNARRAALIHLYFNVVGTLLFMVLFYAGDAVFDFGFLGDTARASSVAVIHTVFNLSATLVLLPFSGLLEKLSYATVRKTRQAEGGRERNAQGRILHAKEKLRILDERFLERPSLAIEHCRQAAMRMAELAKEGVFHALHLFEEYTQEEAVRVKELEELVDQYEDELGTYLVRLSRGALSTKDSHELNELLHCIGDFERISDHSMNLMEGAGEMHRKGLTFSAQAKAELSVYSGAVRDILNLAIRVFNEEDAAGAQEVEPLEETIDLLSAEMKTRHIGRLRAGTCTIELGFILADMTANFERIADHCSNIAVCLIQIAENGMEVHGYLKTVRHSGQGQFELMVEENRKKYELPQMSM
ncbi:MAG: Na/Pi cotransporter family protein [Lachnospiraceae bacterium]|nr:Na/Pi cotransporter family protein [Lachnospiraceae bacterium]